MKFLPLGLWEPWGKSRQRMYEPEYMQTARKQGPLNAAGPQNT